MKCLILIFFLVFVQNSKSLDTIKHCCNLGTNHSSAGSKCSNLPAPNVQKDLEPACLKSMELCCFSKERELQCDAGKKEAKEGKACGKSNDSKSQKDCCEACGLGITAGKSDQPCQGLGFDSQFDNALTECCKDTSTTSAGTTLNTNPTLTSVSSTRKKSSSSDAPPMYNSLCEIEDICAQICVPTETSYRCDCQKGFTLMADGISCKPDKLSTKQGKGNRCHSHSPCDHICSDTGLAIKCSCRDGYRLGSDKKSCEDIDECALGTHDCAEGETCINDDGNYYCEEETLESQEFGTNCPAGFKFNGEKSVCDDIDECEFGIMCPRPQKCINSIGSFTCEGDDLQCPPGYYYMPVNDTCLDIDECVTDTHDCNKESQTCLNTKGNFTCIDKVSKRNCPPGFKKNLETQICEDINECEGKVQLCGPSEECVNENGGHSCKPLFGSSSKSQTTLKNDIDNNINSIYQTTSKTTKAPACPKGFHYSSKSTTCLDINECDQNPCDSTQQCVNIPGSYNCQCKSGYSREYYTGACVDINECQMGMHECTETQRCDNTVGSYYCARIAGCGTGYTLNSANDLCEDDDECALGTHTCGQLGSGYKCRNILGSYRCDQITTTTTTTIPPPTTKKAEPVTYRNPYTYMTPFRTPYTQKPSTVTQKTEPVTYRNPYTYMTPVRIPYTQKPITSTVRPNKLPSFPIVTKPITSYIPWYMQTTSTPHTSSSWTQGYRPKQCFPGYRLNYRGECEDINECESNPCKKGEACLNLSGRHQCYTKVQCRAGYELNEAGDGCQDVNECSRNTHKCNPTQLCKNADGYYTCECPPGHHLNPHTQTCEDIDECKYGGVCSPNSHCINTIGSHKCECKQGFKEVAGGSCVDINECSLSNGFCEHKCVNVWGSYRCACEPGFTLNFDNKTCTDTDECEMFKDKKLCIGKCENIPGSYKCTCPNGYRLGSDGRTCQDNDECQHNICPRTDDICVNTRGGYKCYAITCPSNYVRDPYHKSQCKRAPTYCDPRDTQCLLMPEQYTYHYIAVISNLPVLGNEVKFFQIFGPAFNSAKADFNFKVVNVNCPYGVPRINDNFFRIDRSKFNTLELYLVRTIVGPQEAELEIEMKLFNNNQLAATLISKIFIIVSEYSF